MRMDAGERSFVTLSCASKEHRIGGSDDEWILPMVKWFHWFRINCESEHATSHKQWQL